MKASLRRWCLSCGRLSNRQGADISDSRNSICKSPYFIIKIRTLWKWKGGAINNYAEKTGRHWDSPSELRCQVTLLEQLCTALSLVGANRGLSGRGWGATWDHVRKTTLWLGPEINCPWTTLLSHWLLINKQGLSGILLLNPSQVLGQGSGEEACWIFLVFLNCVSSPHLVSLRPGQANLSALGLCLSPVWDSYHHTWKTERKVITTSEIKHGMVKREVQPIRWTWTCLLVNWEIKQYSHL